MTIEYPTLTALMAGREPGSVKVRRASWPESSWVRVGRLDAHGLRVAIDHAGYYRAVIDHDGPWFIVAEDPALDTLRLEIAARIRAELRESEPLPFGINDWTGRHGYALAEADALLAEARRTPSAEARK